MSEQQRREQRLAKLAELGDNAYVTYPADGDVKGQMTVFTDISCPYCQRLHQDIPQLNAASITVHYLPYPR
ncbi:thioredoxin fold domain-containing protein [Halomonas elongata]|uniref:thioredoxin fold domain-containing protein n=1 Tax=Halomonas elongata TaxID=2746 RepID=UPI0023B057AC|nr:thioredoxin fold domain-containing protein [Halomonas elongata]